MKKFIRIMFTIIVFLLIAILFKIIYNNTLFRKTSFAEIETLIAKQEKIDKNLTMPDVGAENAKIILNPYGNSPLTALMLFKTDEEVSPIITIKGKDELTTYVYQYPESKEHYISIYGLYAGSENEVVLKINDKDYDYLIKTEELPKEIALPTRVEAKKEALEDDLYFFTAASTGYPTAYDVNGDVRWYLKQRAPWRISRLKNGNLLLGTERLINDPYYVTGLYEVDLMGKIHTEFSLEGGYHHDYFELDNGNLIVASDDFSKLSNTVEDIIVELDRKTGEVIKTWDLKKILPMTDAKSETWSEYDWFHNNSVWYDEKTNSLTLSGRHQDAVINIDYDSAKLNWIIGDPTNWSEKMQKYFFKPEEGLEWQWSQHAAMITPDDQVFILDNGNNKSKIKEEYVPAEQSYTRGVIYDINTDDMTIKQVWQYGKERGSDFYSPYISDVDYLGKNHYLVHSGGIVKVDGKPSNRPAGFNKDAVKNSITVELLNDEVIFEIDIPTNYYRVEKMKLYKEDETRSFAKAKRLGSVGSTEVDDITYRGLISFRKTEKLNEKYDLKITNEIDRLVVSAKFKTSEKVRVLLSKNFKVNIYDVVVSKRPYTALCVDIYTEEEKANGIPIVKYINKEDLKGKYLVFLEIDGKIYRTDKYLKID